jgi:hypothetical protein
MKKLTITIIAFIVALGSASAQAPLFRSYVEITKVSPKMGVAIGYKNNLSWEFGVFYQEASVYETLFTEERDYRPYNYEKTFVGLFFTAPITVSELFDIKCNVRTGVVNGENFVITPTIGADYKLSKKLLVGVGVGARAFRPTLQASVAYSLANFKKMRTIKMKSTIGM